MLKLIVSPAFRLLIAVTRFVLPGLKSVLSSVLTEMIAAGTVVTLAATAAVAKRRAIFFMMPAGMRFSSAMELTFITIRFESEWQGLSAGSMLIRWSLDPMADESAHRVDTPRKSGHNRIIGERTRAEPSATQAGVNRERP